MNDLQGHSRSLPLLPFYRPYTISYQSSIVSISILHCFRDINTYLPKSRHVTLPTLVITILILVRPTCAQNLAILSSAIPQKFKGCEILKWITWPGTRLFHGWSVVRRLKLNIACKHTKIDVLQPFQKYFRGCQIPECVTWPWPRPLWGQLVIWRLVLLAAKPCTKSKVCSFSRFEDILWGVKF